MNAIEEFVSKNKHEEFIRIKSDSYDRVDVYIIDDMIEFYVEDGFFFFSVDIENAYSFISNNYNFFIKDIERYNEFKEIDNE